MEEMSFCRITKRNIFLPSDGGCSFLVAFPEKCGMMDKVSVSLRYMRDLSISHKMILILCRFGQVFQDEKRG